MARILFFNLAAHGHINPTLPLAEELIARGAEVTYAAPFQTEKTIRASGASFLGYTSTLGQLAAQMGPGARGHLPLPLRMVDEAAATVPELLEHTRRLAPDVIAFDAMCLAGRIIAEHLRIPAVRLCPTYVANEHFSLMNVAMRRGGALDPALFEPVNARGQELAARYQVRPIVFPGFLSDADALNIVFLSRAFQPAGDTFDPRFVFVGPSLKDRPPSGDFPLEELDRRGAPVLLISLGTVFNDWPAFFDMCFEAFGGAPWTVVVSIGDRVDPAIVARAPANFIVRPHVPQLEVLKRARAFVTHGGMNSTQEALFFGVPLVVVPQMLEQAATADRVAELGLGVALERDTTTAGALAAAVARISTEPSFAERVREIQVHTREAGGYPRAAQAILDFVRG